MECALDLCRFPSPALWEWFARSAAILPGRVVAKSARSSLVTAFAL